MKRSRVEAQPRASERSAELARQQSRLAGTPRRAGWRCGLWSCLLPGLLFLAGNAANASALGLTLSWQAPSACPTRSAVILQVERLVGLGASAAGAPIAASGQVRREAGVFILSLTLESVSGSIARELRSRDCAVVARGAATLLALAITGETEAGTLEATANVPVATSAAPASSTFTTPGANAARAPTIPDEAGAAVESRQPATRDSAAARAAPVSTDQARIQRAWIPWLSLGAGLYGAALPGPRPDLFGELGLERPVFSLSLRAGHVFAIAQSLPRDASSRASADFVALTSCAAWETRRWRVGPCLTLQGTRLHASSRGLVEARDGNALWAQAGLGAAVRLRLARRGQIGLASGFLLPLTARPRLEVEGLGPIEQGAVLSGYTHFDVGIRFE